MLKEINQLFIESDRSKKDIVFVLNKVDQLDEENGEQLSQIMNRTKTYLVEAGFPKPVIIPTMAHAAKLLRLVSGGHQLTRRQRRDACNMFDMLSNNPTRLLDVTKLDEDIRNEIRDGINGNGHSLIHKSSDVKGKIKIGDVSIQRSAFEQAVYSTGIHTIESLLEKMIYKRALPETINRVSLIMKKYDANLLEEWLHNENKKEY